MAGPFESILDNLKSRQRLADGGPVKKLTPDEIAEIVNKLIEKTNNVLYDRKTGEVKPAVKRGLARGGEVIAKRGLVDGPGGYAGQRYNLAPVEGEPYIKTFNTKGGEKRYYVKYSKQGFNKKFTAPGTKEGLAQAIKFRDNIDKEFSKKFEGQVVQPSVRKLKEPSNPSKPWIYKRAGKPQEYFATEEQARVAQKKAVKVRGEQMKKPITQKELEIIKPAIESGISQPKLSEQSDISMRRIRRAIEEYNIQAPESYVQDKFKRQQIIDNYGKLSRSSLAKLLFPDSNFTLANSRIGKMIQDLSKTGELKVLPIGTPTEERKSTFSTEPKDVQRKKVTERRIRKLDKLGSKPYELHLSEWKRNFQKALGLKRIGGFTSSYPIDMAHRSDIEQLARFREQLTPSDLGPDYYKSNREGVKKFETGVKTLERQLKPLYSVQRNLYTEASKYGVDNIPESLKQKIDKNNIDITELVKDGVGGRIKPILINVDTLDVIRGDQNITKTLGIGLVNKPMSQIQFPSRKNNFTGSVEDATIKANLANQIIKESVDQNLISREEAEARSKEFLKTQTLTPKQAKEAQEKVFSEQGTGKMIFDKYSAAKPAIQQAAKYVPGSSLALAPADLFLNYAAGVPLYDSLASAGSYLLKDPVISRAVNVPLAIRSMTDYGNTQEMLDAAKQRREGIEQGITDFRQRVMDTFTPKKRPEGIMQLTNDIQEPDTFTDNRLLDIVSP